jgi:hypothetical protein
MEVIDGSHAKLRKQSLMRNMCRACEYLGLVRSRIRECPDMQGFTYAALLWKRGKQEEIEIAEPAPCRPRYRFASTIKPWLVRG